MRSSRGFSWPSSGLDFAIALQGAWVLSLIRKLRSWMLPCGPPPKKKKKKKPDIYSFMFALLGS